MSQKLRIIIPLALLGAAGVAYAAHVSAGTLSAFGWESISLICPIGALGTMLASKMLVPRAVISIVLAVAAILLLGRAFCGWLCPVPVWSKLRGIFKKGDGEAAPPSGAEKRALKTSCAGACSSCADRKPADSRHIILGGTLLSAAIFGFPVFCLVCPVGLSFALVFLLIALFGGGDVTWSVLIIPVLIAAEVIFFRKWLASVPHLVVHEPHRSRQSHVPAGHRRCEVPGDFPWCHLRALRRGVRGGHQPAPSGAGHYLQRVHPLPRLRRRVPRACHQLPAYRPQDSRRPGAGANAGWGERHTGHRV